VIAFRTMTYGINQGRGPDGCFDLERIGGVIAAADTDLVALQGITEDTLKRGLAELPQRLGMAAYGLESASGLAFFSRYPLRAYRAYDLGHDGRCLQLDFDLHERRVHLFNLALSYNPIYRRCQLEALQGEELLGNPRLSCPLVIHGDFSLPLPDPNQIRFCSRFRRASMPRWRATWPAACPLLGRDRIYLQGDIKEIAGHIPWSEARHASSHLPLIVALQLVDSRTFLTADTPLPKQVELATEPRAGAVSRL